MNSKPTVCGAALAGALLLIPLCCLARQGTPPLSRQLKLQRLQTVRQITLAPIDAPAEKAEDARIGVPTPLRFAVPTSVQITPATDGTWEQVAGGRLWRLRIASAGATDLNFGFSTCWLPDGATLHIYSEDEDYFQGPYSVRDNKPHRQLWTPVVPGSRAVIELFVPAGAREEPELVLSQINRGYRDMFHLEKDLSIAKAGSCNNDVICPQADPWRNEIRSVARFSISGVGLCTGTLINNVSNDFKNYFLTANHCSVSAANASSVVVYWNFESPTCGQHSGGSLAQNQNGAIFRAGRADVDFTLIELEDVPDSSFHVFYSGWDHSGSPPAGAVGIHHPNADEKSISFSSTPLTTTDNCIGTGGVNSHWRVVWNSGVTEPGSSGSAIWDPNTHRIVGFLSGGDSGCDAPQGPDCYGKFSVAWSNAAGTSSTRLRDWLDPANASTSVAGRDPNPVPLLLAESSALVTEGCTPTNGVIDPGEVVSMRFAFKNIGGANTTAAVATLLATNGVTFPGAPQSYGVLSTNGMVVSRNFTFTASGNCGGSVTPTLSIRDGSNNLGTFSFAMPLGIPNTSLTENFDLVTAPALPAGWTSSADVGLSGWFARTVLAQSVPNSVFAADANFEGESVLSSLPIAITSTNAQLSFSHHYDTEDFYDGGVLDISTDNGASYNDIIGAGGSFVQNGYDATLRSSLNPLSDRDAWTGYSGSGFLTTVVRLPMSAAGQQVRFRWRMGSDESIGYDGWYVDDIVVSDGFTCCHSAPAPQIIETRFTDANVVFSFNTLAGQSYITEYKSALSTGVVWTALQTNVGDGLKKSVTNSVGVAGQRFFRVKTQ